MGELVTFQAAAWSLAFAYQGLSLSGAFPVEEFIGVSFARHKPVIFQGAEMQHVPRLYLLMVGTALGGRFWEAAIPC